MKVTQKNTNGNFEEIKMNITQHFKKIVFENTPTLKTSIFKRPLHLEKEPGKYFKKSARDAKNARAYPQKVQM